MIDEFIDLIATRISVIFTGYLSWYRYYLFYFSTYLWLKRGSICYSKYQLFDLRYFGKHLKQ